MAARLPSQSNQSRKNLALIDRAPDEPFSPLVWAWRGGGGGRGRRAGGVSDSREKEKQERHEEPEERRTREGWFHSRAAVATRTGDKDERARLLTLLVAYMERKTALEPEGSVERENSALRLFNMFIMRARF